MNLSININLDNAAFEDPAEVARVLARVAKQVEALPPGKADIGCVRDSNGNAVGAWNVTR